MAAAFFPQVANQQFGISNVWIGVIFAILPASVALFSSFAAFLCGKFSRFPVMVTGFAFEIVGLIVFGLSSKLPMLCISRVISGIAAAFMQVSSLAMLVSNVKEVNEALGMQEIFSGLGFVFGAPLGGFVYAALGFHWVFFIASMLIGCMLFYALTDYIYHRQLWSEFEAEKTEEDESIDEESVQKGLIQKDDLPILPVLKLLNGEMISLASSATVLFLIMGGIEPILAPHLQQLLNIDVDYVGLIYSLPGLIYAICAAFAWKICQKLTSKVTLISGLILVGGSLCLLGPIPLLDTIPSLTASWLFVLIGSTFWGFGMGMAFVPGIPMMRESANRVSVQYKAEFSSTEKFLSNYTSAIFNSFASLGQVIGPLSAGLLMDILPQRIEATCDGSQGECTSGIQWTMVIYSACCILVCVPIQLLVPNLELK
jgi:MFS family permease